MLVIGIVAHSQKTGNRTEDSIQNSIIEEKLVELAIKGPRMQELQHQNKINEYQLKSAKNAWMNILSFSINYNDQSFAHGQTPANYVYPKYFFGLNIPLGTLFSRTSVKSAQENIEISKATQEELKRQIRADVLTKYKQYLAYGELIDIQTEMINDVQVASAQAEDKFRKGTISIDVYSAAQRAKNDEAAKLINLQLQQDLVKLEIERMIGTSLESVIK